MIVVSDTSPILNLARIGRLELLLSLYRRVLIPPAVFEELAVSSDPALRVIDVTSVLWIVVESPRDQDRVQVLREVLDAGEAEAIVLAVELKADLLLVDEKTGGEWRKRWDYGSRVCSECLPTRNRLGLLNQLSRCWTN